MTLGKQAAAFIPEDVSNNVFNLTVKTLLNFGLAPQIAKKSLEDLIKLADQLGPFGREAIAVAAMLMTYTTDRELVKRGIDLLENNNDLLFITAGSTPFKPMGMYLTLAEAYVFLGDYPSAQAYIDKAYVYAKNVQFPPLLLMDFQRTADELLDQQNGLGKKWESTQPLGMVRMPPSPSMGRDGCVYCHADAR